MVDRVPVTQLPPREGTRPHSLGAMLREVAALPMGIAQRYTWDAKPEAVRAGNKLAYMLRDRGVATRHQVNGCELMIWRVGECNPPPSRRRKTGGGR